MCFLTARDSTAFHLCLTTSTGWFYSREVLWMKATHRAITAHTMAEVLEGRYNHKIRSVRIIDCRYCLLKITFVRINANMFNVQLSIFKVQIWIWRRPYTRGWELATWRGTQFIFKLKKSTSNDWTKIVHYACFCSGWRISERVLSSLEASSFQSPRQLRRSNVSPINGQFKLHKYYFISFGDVAS